MQQNEMNIKKLMENNIIKYHYSLKLFKELIY